MAAIFGKRKIFLKNGQSILLIYSVGQKFCRNRSISHGLGDTRNLRLTILVKNLKIQNGCLYLAHIPCGPENFTEIALSRTV